MKVHLPDHSHCMNCGDPVIFGKEFCSSQCQLEREGEKKRVRRRNLIFYIVAIVAILFVWLYSYIL
ncbi:MAG: DUF2116 family Zn-ribbon domain-containing protein [Euryarchaeota archaeon]|nr:DUF2116 family Zn-ribbon domain-containing protein [Euryarchaeota archaeon]